MFVLTCASVRAWSLPQRDVSEISSSTLIQMVLNWTLAEMVNDLRPQGPPPPEEQVEGIYLSEVEDWYSQVVVPILQLLQPPGEESPISEDIKLAFHHLL